MTPSFCTRLSAVCLLALGANALDFNISGEAITSRFWDCCKPSCAWKFKAEVGTPVQACSKDSKPVDVNAGTGCNGGTAFQCSDQQPWAVNDTFSYGFAGAHILPSLTGGKLEDAWCCACYRLDFTSDPLRGKSMIIQASNTAYDINDANRFSLAIPGGNTTNDDACHIQYGVPQNVFGQNNAGVSSKDNCENLPEPLRPGCEWRYAWFQDASFPTLNFKRVTCPKELTDKTKCVRKDDNPQEQQAGDTKKGAASNLYPALSAIVIVPVLMGTLFL